MPFPASWPPRVPSGIRSIRFFASGVAAAAFDANAFMFLDGAGANPIIPAPNVPYGSNAPVVNPLTPTGTGTTTPPIVHPMLWSGNIRICNDGGATLEYSFDGTNVHGRILASESFTYRNRYEAGIAVRGAGAAFRVEAW
jgi:hypothetical protein